MDYAFMVADQQPHTHGGVAAFPADNTGFLQSVLEAQGFRIATKDEYDAQVALVPHNVQAETLLAEQNGDTDGLANKALAAPTPEGSDTAQVQAPVDIQDQIEAHDVPPQDAAS